MSPIDYIILAIYLSIVLGVGFLLGRNEDSENFFVNGRKTGTFLLIFTALSTSVGAGSVLGMASAAYTTGISLGLVFILVSAFGWGLMAYLAPRIKRWSDSTNAYTLGDYFLHRYSERTKKIAAIVILVSAFLSTAIQFVAFGKLIETMLGLPLTVALVATALFTITYTVLAGIKGDFYTDAIQFFVMMPVFFMLFYKTMTSYSWASIAEVLPATAFDPFAHAGPVFFFAGVLFGFPLILVSMDIWQRIFAASSPATVRKAFIYSGLLKVVVIAASVMLGFMALRVVPGVDGDTAIYEMMIQILPAGVLGIGFASILAILMSTIDSVLMVGSATLTKDFYLARNPNASEKQKLFMGRVYIVYFGLASLAVALLFQDIVALSVASVQSVSVFAPALLGGLLWKKSSSNGAFWSILIGFITVVGSYPFLKDTSFVPGILIAAIIFIVFSIYEARSRKAVA